jgi:predicted DNA binding protein
MIWQKEIRWARPEQSRSVERETLTYYGKEEWWSLFDFYTQKLNKYIRDYTKIYLRFAV